MPPPLHPVPSRTPAPADVTWTHVIYALHGAGVTLGIVTSAFVVTAFLFGLPSIVAVILNYVKRADVRGTYLDSHFSWQLRTFWFALLWLLAAFLFSLPLMLVVVGFATLWVAAIVIGLWVIYRVARGWVNLSAGRAMYA
jgi:uncharacterized membrane protein